MPADTWTHIVVVREGNDIRVWKNGIKVSDQTYSLPTLNCNNAKYKIGSDYRTKDTSTETTRFKGLLDDFRIYMTALDEASIKDLYEPAIYMTNNNELMANEFLEADEIEMTNTSLVKASKFIEEVDKNYEFLEYIISTRSQYIDTGYVPTTDFTIELNMEWTGSTVSTFESFAGFMHADKIPRAGIHKYSSTFMIGGNSTTNSSVAPVKNQQITLVGDFTSGNQHMYKNGVSIVTDTTALDFSANEQSIYIFGRNASNKQLASMKLYRGKIYNGAGLIRDFVPARRKSDNAIGLYDIVTATFYTNSGSGEFTVGPTISNDKVSMYTSNNVSAQEYIEI